MRTQGHRFGVVDGVVLAAFAIAVIVFLAYLVRVPVPSTSATLVNTESADMAGMTAVDFVGTYQEYADSDVGTVRNTVDYDSLGWQQLILTGRFSMTIPQGEQIHMYLKGVSVAIYRNDKQIYAYGFSEMHPDTVSSVGSGWDTFTSPGIARGDTVTIVITKAYPDDASDAYVAFLDSLCIGSTHRLALNQVGFHIGTIIAAILSIILGLVLIAVALALRFSKSIAATTHLAGGALLVFAGAEPLFDCRFATLLIPNTYLVNLLGITALLLGVECAIAFMASATDGTVTHRIAHAWTVVWAAVVIGGLVSMAIGSTDATSLFRLLKLPMAVSVAVSLAILAVDTVMRRKATAFVSLVAGAIAAGGIVAQIAVFSLTSRPWPASAPIGFIVLAIILLFSMGGSVRRSDREQAARFYDGTLDLPGEPEAP